MIYLVNRYRTILFSLFAVLTVGHHSTAVAADTPSVTCDYVENVGIVCCEDEPAICVVIDWCNEEDYRYWREIAAILESPIEILAQRVAECFREMEPELEDDSLSISS